METVMTNPRTITRPMAGPHPNLEDMTMHAQSQLHVGQAVLLGDFRTFIALIATGRALLANGQWIALRRLQPAA
jgi:hypothetical protein